MNTPVSLEIDRLLLEKNIDMPVSPSIADVVMWLYKKCGIWIEVVWDIELNKELKWYSGVTNIGDSSELEIFQSNPCNSPTEAYEAAIHYTLKNLI